MVGAYSDSFRRYFFFFFFNVTCRFIVLSFMHYVLLLVRVLFVIVLFICELQLRGVCLSDEWKPLGIIFSRVMHSMRAERWLFPFVIIISFCTICVTFIWLWWYKLLSSILNWTRNKNHFVSLEGDRWRMFKWTSWNNLDLHFFHTYSNFEAEKHEKKSIYNLLNNFSILYSLFFFSLQYFKHQKSTLEWCKCSRKFRIIAYF